MAGIAFASIIFTLILLVFVCVFFVIPRKHVFVDRFGHAQQGRYLGILGLFGMAIWAIHLTVFSEGLERPANELTFTQYVFQWVFVETYVVLLFVLNWLENLWILKRQGIDWKKTLLSLKKGTPIQDRALSVSANGTGIEMNSIRRDTIVFVTDRVLNEIDDPDTQNDKALKLIDVLKYRYTFDLFVDHSVFEWNLENNLALIEFVEWRTHWHAVHRDMLMTPIKSLKEVGIVLPLEDKEFPRSAIVYGGASMDVSLCMLVDKYISNESPYQVNLGFKERQYIVKMAIHARQQTDEWAVLSMRKKLRLFDWPINTIIRLNGDIWSRFISTDAYVQCEAFIFHHKLK